nr:hypothetical protein [Tanacetum cinerariifolium]
AGRGRRHPARRAVVAAARGAGGALRLRRLRRLRAPFALAGSGVLVADRDVRAADPQGQAGRLARALPVGRGRRTDLLPYP